MKRRLFLFAAYDAAGQVGASLLWYMKALSENGDIIFVADSDFDGKQMELLEPYVLHAEATRHGEYDFGSYKRAFKWAQANCNMTSYDYVYMVNDSVYGPLYDIRPYLEKMESLGTEAFGLVHNPHRRTPHLQSWFIGMSGLVYSSQWFSDFIESVTAEGTKEDVCVKYETGFTELLVRHSIKTAALFYVSGKKIYNSVYRLYRQGLPFLKKAAIVRHNGCLGGKVSRILNCLEPQCRGAILSDADRVYGAGYMNGFLTGNPIVIAARYISYLWTKAF
jgi:lipopolysaccharide biosynthesis protein